MEKRQTRKLRKIQQATQSLQFGQDSTANSTTSYMWDAVADTASQPRGRDHASTAPCWPALSRKEEDCVDVLPPVGNVEIVTVVEAFGDIDDIVADAVVVVNVRVLMPVDVDDVIVVVRPPAHLEAPIQVSYSFGGAKMPAPPKEQPRRGLEVSPCLV